MEKTSSQGEADKMPVAAKGGGTKRRPRKNKRQIFHRYMDLPFELRQQIRIKAINEAIGSFTAGSKNETRCSRLASVSKEWQPDVEKTLFGEIYIDPSNVQEVTRFKELLTDERKKFIGLLGVAVDDSKETGPWHRDMGLVQISQVMANIGHFLKYINGWDFVTSNGGRRSIKIAFATSRVPNERIHWPNDHRLSMTTTSLWEASKLSVATHNGFVPIDMALWAIKSEFPSSLSMVTHLSIPPDCVPLPAAQKILQTMPNLDTCVLSPRFDIRVGRAWKDLTNLISQVPISAPSLRNLMLCNMTHSDHDTFDEPTDTMVQFAAALRDYSQGLESLRANPFELDREFFLPFSPIRMEIEPMRTTWDTPWSWPRLQYLELQFFDDARDVDSELEEEVSDDGQASGHQQALNVEPDTLRLLPADILIAAGRAAIAMPVLEAAHISIRSKARGNPAIFLKRKLRPNLGGTASSRMWLSGIWYHEFRVEVRDAWAHFLGPEPRYDDELMAEFHGPYGSRN